MKKSVVAVALVGALGVTAHAATVSEFANGVLVPRVIDNGGGNSTAIGLTSCAPGVVYWTFYDVNTKHVADDQFGMTADDQANLVWNTSQNPGTNRLFGGQDLRDLEGYLVFILDTTGDARLSATPGNSDVPCLAGNAFQVDLTGDDVAYVPTLPLDIRPAVSGDNTDFGDFLDFNNDGIYVDSLIDMNETDVAGLNAGANGGDVLYMRYFLADAEDQTSIYIWSSQDLQDSYTIQMYDDNQQRRSLTMDLINKELNTVNPRTIRGRPSSFVDGFIRWQIPLCHGDESGFGPTIDCPTGGTTDLVRGVVSWSVIDSPTFGAVQTVVNPIRLVGSTGSLAAGTGVPAFRVRVVEDANGSVPGHSLEGAAQ